MEVERDKKPETSQLNEMNESEKTNICYKSHAVAEEREKGIQKRNKERNVELQREFKSVKIIE